VAVEKREEMEEMEQEALRAQEVQGRVEVGLLLEVLSNELVVHVLSFLDLAPDLVHVSVTCRALHELAHDASLWRRIDLPRLAHLIVPPSHRTLSPNPTP
jgi:acetylglutamate synthase